MEATTGITEATTGMTDAYEWRGRRVIGSDGEKIGWLDDCLDKQPAHGSERRRAHRCGVEQPRRGGSA